MRRHGKPVIFLVHHLKTSDPDTQGDVFLHWERRLFHARKSAYKNTSRPHTSSRDFYSYKNQYTMDQIFKAIITIGNRLVISFIIWYIPYKLRRMEDKLEEINKRTKLANIKIDITYYESLVRLESILIK